MKTYILDIIPKIQKYSQKLDNLTFLLNKHWLILDEETSSKTVFIFREKDNQLLISNNGKIEKGNWEYLENNSLLIDRKDGSSLFKKGFIDDYVLALKLDGKEEYALLVNEQWYKEQGKSLESILNFLNEKYLVQKGENKISIPTKDTSSINNFKININSIEIPERIRKKIDTDMSNLYHTLKHIDDNIRLFNSIKYPFYVALTLDSKNIKIEEDLIKELIKVAKRDFGLETINEVLEIIVEQNP
jgi:hypothetical protein